MNELSSQYKFSYLDNGLKLITLRMPWRHAVQLGIITKVGSRDTSPDESGIAHFLEHIFFKGTTKRDAFNLFYELEKVGGWVTAHTSQESTNIYSVVPADYTETAVDILLDIFISPTFPPDEIEKEKRVIFEEIGQIENSPSRRAWERFPKLLWDNHPLSCSVIGTKEEVKNYTRQRVLAFYNSFYTSKNSFFIGVGAVEHEQLRKLIEEKSKNINRSSMTLSRTVPSPSPTETIHEYMDTTQLHIITGRTTFKFDDPRRYAFELLGSILASERDSSRLLQLLREKYGLVYGVYGLSKYYSDTGFYAIDLATSPEQLSRTLEMVREELRQLPETLTEDELEATKLYIRGQAMIESEELSVLFWRLAGLEKLLGTYIPLEDELEKIQRVKLGELKELAEEYLNPENFSTLIVGKENSQEPIGKT